MTQWGDVEDAQVLAWLEACRLRAEAGDRSAVFRAIVQCARFEAVMPQWLADEVVALDKAAAAGTLPDLNEALGYKPPHASTAKAAVALSGVERSVFDALVAARFTGAPWNPETWESVQADLQAQGVAVSVETVRRVYERHREGLKTLPQEKRPDEVTGVLRLSRPDFRRRRGRPIL